MEKLDNILKTYTVSSNELTVKNKLLGAGFVFVDKNGIIYEGPSGRLAFAPGAAPFTTRSLVWLASMTKLPTAVAALQLVERGLLTLDQDLRPLQPELAALEILRGFDEGDGKPILEPNTRPITLHHLLTHTLGLAMDLPVPDLMRWSRAVGRTAVNLDWSRAGMTTPLSFAPGEGWVYGMAYDWAGAVLETLTEESLGRWMQDRIFAPLGMERTGFWPERILGSHKNGSSNEEEEKREEGQEDRLLEFAFSAEDGITGARPYPDAELRPGTSFLRTEHEMESGGAGLFSTPHDYGLCLSGLLRSSSSPNHQEQEQERLLLKPQTLTQLLTPQLTPPQRAQLACTMSAFHTGFGPERERPARSRSGRRGESGRRAGEAAGRQHDVERHEQRAVVGRPGDGHRGRHVHGRLPHGNVVVNRMWDELERAVYGDLLPALKKKGEEKQ
ncbi:Acyltransferase mlcH [Apiospora phragmitis]|uniref:Acyltransferase mlcH n=1 Tax=Apiospora phragmitis TaxID=2905665 RepID=A0ABR1W8Y5_9PEZI